MTNEIPRYKFPESQRKPGYLNVIDPMGVIVGELWGETALVIMMMYDNAYKRNPRLGNELMYGYMLGMTHALMFADKYPKFTLTREGNVTKLTVDDPVLGKVFDGVPELAPGAEKIAHQMIDKAFKNEQDN